MTKVLLAGVVAVASVTVIVLASDRRDGEEVPVVSDSSLPSVVAPTTTILPTTTSSSVPTVVNRPGLGAAIVHRRALTDFVADLEGQLVVLQGRSVFLLITRSPNDTESPTTVVPANWVSDISFDASGDLIGLIASTSDSGRLYLGDDSWLTNMELDVTSYVWHDSSPELVATVFHDGGTWQLITLRYDRSTREILSVAVMTKFDTERLIRAWDDSGFILTGFDEEADTAFIEFVDPTGQILWQQPGHILDVSSTGSILSTQTVDGFTGIHLFQSDSPPRNPSASLLDWAPLDSTAVRWSTDGQMIAFLGFGGAGAVDWGLHVYTPNGDLLHSVVIPGRVWDVQWSPDDRYILMPGRNNQGSNGVVFYDLHTDTVSVVDDFQDWVQWADLRDPPPSTSSSSASTYVDESGRIWYETDCPDADVVLLAGADGLPPKEATEREAVEGYAERNPEYRVIPRNGWVWERLDDGSVSVIQVEDYMLERTIESADQCPGGPVYVGIPVAYRISDD